MTTIDAASLAEDSSDLDEEYELDLGTNRMTKSKPVSRRANFSKQNTNKKATTTSSDDGAGFREIIRSLIKRESKRGDLLVRA